MARSRVVVLASGTGTLLQALMDAAAGDPRGPGAVGGCPFEVVAVVVDRPGTGAEARAGAAGVPVEQVPPSSYPGRAAWDAGLRAVLDGHRPDWVVSAGFLRLLGPDVLAGYAGRVVNSHPALLPAFPGLHGVRDALAYGVRVTGCTVHLVDAGVDTGPVLAQEAVPVVPGDDEAVLHERIKTVERRLLLRVVADLARHGCTVDGRRVTVP